MVIGVFVILIGLLLLLDNFELVDAREYLAYWPALLVMLGVAALVRPGAGGKIWGVVLIIVGGVLLLRRLDLLYISLGDVWPLVLILLGAALIWGTFGRRKPSGEGMSDDALLNATVVLGGFKRAVMSQDFRGGDLTVVMAGCEIDLRRAAIRGEEATINVFALWGGAEIRVPESWTVEVRGVPMLGGFADETMPTGGPSAKRLVVTGTVIMGGVEIKN
jgi:predicted membrane protein